jgi:long-chain acyl-CoA synthetase
MAQSNLSAMHRQTAERLGPRAALRHKQNGLYRDISWEAYRQAADQAACGLIELGVEPQDRIGLLSENRVEWLMADLAMLAAGACNVPIHTPSVPRQVEYELAHSEAVGVFVSNQAQADKVAAVLGALPQLRFLVSFEPIQLSGRLQRLTWHELRRLGWKVGRRGHERLLTREAAVRRTELATIIYTSGTTGPPKGVMLTHENLLSNAQASLEHQAMEPDEILLSWLPYSHIYARTVDHYMTALAGATLCLAECGEALVVNLAETQPTTMTAVPRFYEKVWAGVEHLDEAGRAAELRRLFGPRLRWLSSGGAPLPRHVGAGFHAAGIKLLEGYGLTESSPVITFNRRDSFKVGTVGQAIPGVEVRIADDGEILTRGPHVMKGYWKNPDATAEAIREGWLYTGDVGELDEGGFLKITDRKKDLIITSGGKNIAPCEIERLLISDPYIDQAVVYGDRRPFLSAILVPHFPLLEELAGRLGCPLNVTDDFLDCPPVHAFLAERVATAMRAVSQPERVREFLVLARPFSLAGDELTATLKVRRREIVRKFASQLEQLYACEARACR